MGFHYKSVSIPVGVMVAFRPNANTPLVCLVQRSCANHWGLLARLKRRVEESAAIG